MATPTESDWRKQTSGPFPPGVVIVARVVLGLVGAFFMILGAAQYGHNLRDSNYLLRFLICLNAGVVCAAIIGFSFRKRPATINSALPSQPPAPPRICPRCGRALASETAHGLCPACLLQQASASESGAPNPSAFTPPSVAELAPLFPQLEILELLGRGGMGAVYKARQPGLDRFVALKILPATTRSDPTFAERFQREARALAALNHPHIVAVYDFGQLPTLSYFIMEYVDGVNLRQLERTARLSPREALAIVPQVCEALQFAHDRGIVHRDIKPENILVDKQGRVKIADFGLAKLLRAEPGGFALTETRHAVGTPQYMAPEQVEKPQSVDHRADIYSLGVVFYEMLTGELPLGRFPVPSQRVQVDVRLDEVVLKALEKEPDRRYQQASAFKTNVETFATAPGQPTPALPTPVTPPPPTALQQPRAKFSRLAIAGAVWAVVFFFFFLTWFMATARVEVHPGQTPPGPTWWQILLRFTLLPLGIAAPFGTTILGRIALSQICRSAGRLYGLGLALFDSLLFPLLLVDGLIWYLLAVNIRQRLMWAAASSWLWLADIGPQLFAAVLLVAVDLLVIFWAWRAVKKPLAGAPPAETPPPPPPASALPVMSPGQRAGQFGAWVLYVLAALMALWPVIGLIMDFNDRGHGPRFAICWVIAAVIAALGRILQLLTGPPANRAN